MFNREKNVYAVTNAYLIENICNNLRLPLCPLPIVSYYFTKNTFFMQILRKKDKKWNWTSFCCDWNNYEGSYDNFEHLVNNHDSFCSMNTISKIDQTSIFSI